MSESVLERSVLERKEREELQTIARAMGAEPPARAKKADLVDLILTTAGISPGPADDGAAVEAAPAARRRTRRTEPKPSLLEADALGGAALDGARAADTAPEDMAPEDMAPEDMAPAGAAVRDAADGTDVDGTGREVPGGTAGEGGAPLGAVGADAAAGGAAPVPAAIPSTTEEDQREAIRPASPDQDHDHAGANGFEPSGSPDAGRSREPGPRPLPFDNQRDRPSREVTDNGAHGHNDAETAPPSGEPARDRDRENGRARDERNRPPAVTEDDNEPGNRRRRRRGRDREGWREGGPREQAPAPAPREGRPEESFTGEPVPIAGLLDLRDEGYGFVRIKGYLPSKEDAYISVKQARQFGLRKGDHITGASRPANRNEKNPALLRIDTVNGKDPEEARKRPRFEDLTPLFPDERLKLELPGATNDMTARIVDLIAPIGKGQRGLIVSPPKAGKTTVLKQIVKSIEMNNPEVHLMVLLVDERPEEVTDMRRSTQGEVIASTFDRPSDEHTAVAELAGERAKRLVEEGRDVVIVLDGITRLARAYNLAAPATGRIMSGGVDSGALYPPKRFFGSARNIEEGGSLTILATALIETGSKMDEVIFEEFKGTGNMELRLDRRLAERRIYPAIDVDASSTRHEELLFDRKQLQQVWRVRRALNALSSADGATPAVALERLMDGMRTFASNEEFLAQAAKTGTAAGS